MPDGQKLILPSLENGRGLLLSEVQNNQTHRPVQKKKVSRDISTEWKSVPSEYQAMPESSHMYDDADIRIVVEDTVFEVHRLFLKYHAEYFRAMFSGPWIESTQTVDNGVNGTLRQIKLHESLVTAEQFTLLLDWIYRSIVKTGKKPFRMTGLTAFHMELIANVLQIDSLNSLCQTFFATTAPDYITWENVEELLEKATARGHRLQGCISHCNEFLLRECPSYYIRCCFLAEKFDLPAITDTVPHSRCLLSPWKDPFFTRLSQGLQNSLLLYQLQHLPIHCSECTPKSHCSEKTRLYCVSGQHFSNKYTSAYLYGPKPCTAETLSGTK
ncbi:hypothetical protein DFJ77DRAFT_438895 [Powellomyces hirtus]|nr:hypothetical protein DFJ77DRAFT_438895 [Powellomyces hirtus]